MSYKNESIRLYNKWFDVKKEHSVHFFCDPILLFEDEKISTILKLVKDEIEEKQSFSIFIKEIDKKPFSEKYLFLLAFVLLISGNENDERSYWKTFEEHFNIRPSAKEKLSILKLFSSSIFLPFI